MKYYLQPFKQNYFTKLVFCLFLLLLTSFCLHAQENSPFTTLRFIFAFYKLKIYDSELSDPNFKIDSVLIAHYKKVSEYMGYLVKPDETQVNNWGYQMLAKKQYSKAEKLFKLNIANNPYSGNDYDSIGDFYLAINNKAKAIEAFKKALTLQAIPETKQKLDKLLNENKVKVK